MICLPANDLKLIKDNLWMTNLLFLKLLSSLLSLSLLFDSFNGCLIGDDIFYFALKSIKKNAFEWDSKELDLSSEMEDDIKFLR